jgi:sorting nexin-9/18/33
MAVITCNLLPTYFFTGKSDGKATVGRKNFNRFTTFVKSGGESYILGTVKVAVGEEDKVYIYVSRTSAQSDDNYAC